MTSSLKNKMPAWDFRSSYGSLSSPAYRKACQRLEADIHILAGLVPNAKDSVSIAIALEHLAEVFCLTDSLIGYCRCLSAIDTREQEAAKERVRLWEIHSRYYELITELFHRLAGLKKSDPIWKELDFSKWEWLFERVSTRWSFSLSPRTLQLLYELKASNFVPCADLYHSLNAHLVATVRTMDGLTKHQSHSQCIAVLKTSEDPKLRQSTFTALNEYYSQNAYLYASIFNMLTGFRLKGFEFAEMDFMAPAYWQNAVSSEAVDALMTAVRANRLRCAEKFIFLMKKRSRRLKKSARYSTSVFRKPSTYLSKRAGLKYASCRENKTALSSKVFCRLMSREFFQRISVPLPL